MACSGVSRYLPQVLSVRRIVVEERGYPMLVVARLGTSALGGVIALFGAFALTQASNGYVLDLFQINTIPIGAYLCTGLLGLVAALIARGRYAAWYPLAIGVFYGILAVVGFLLEGQIPVWGTVNVPDNLLHAGIALVALGLGFFLVAARPELFMEA